VFHQEANPDDWAMVQHSLSNLLLGRYERNGDENVARECESCCNNALRVYAREVSPLDWALEHHMLGTLSLVRFERSWDDGHARNAENHYNNALEEFRFEVSPLNWAMVHHSLGNLFLGRYERGRNKEAGSAAQLHYQNALKVYRRNIDPSHWAGVKYALANLFAHRYEGSEDESHAEAAERYYHDALLEYRRESAPALWALVQHALGSLFYYRYEKSGENKHAQSAEKHYKNSLQEYRSETAPTNWATVQHGLGSLFSLRYEHSGNNIDARTAKEHYLAIHDYALLHGLPLIFSYKANASLTRLSFHQSDWHETLRAYTLTQEALQVLLAVQTLRSGKETWLAEAYGLSPVAAYAYAQLGQYEDAVVTFETGRIHLLREVLEQNRRDLIFLNELGYQSLLNRFENAIVELDRLSKMEKDLPVNWIDKLQIARLDLNEAITAIQAIPEFREFMRPPAFSQIAQVAHDNPLVYLLATSAGGFSLIILGKKIQPVPLDSVTEDLVKTWLIEQKDGRSVGGYLHGQIGDVDIRPELDKVLPAIGERVIGPLIPVLRELGLKTLTFISSGLFALLPFHAASYNEDGKACILLDEFAISYVPSASILKRSQQIRLGQDNEPHSLLAIGNPTPLPEGYSSLRFAQMEVEEVSKIFTGRVQSVYESDATLEYLVEKLALASYLHFACHAEFDHLEPLNSGLILSDGERLTLKDLLEHLKLHEPTRLAVLSACKTAITDFSKLPEEAIGLPAAFLQAGALGVIGTLWPVDDLSTVLLMMRFYQYYLKSDLAADEASISPSEALRKAQLWLRDATNRELREYVKRLLSEQETQLAATNADKAYKRLTLEDDDSHPYAHPYYWAGFTFHGA